MVNARPVGSSSPPGPRCHGPYFALPAPCGRAPAATDHVAEDVVRRSGQSQEAQPLSVLLSVFTAPIRVPSPMCPVSAEVWCCRCACANFAAPTTAVTSGYLPSAFPTSSSPRRARRRVQIRALGLALGGRGAQRLAHLLGISVSDRTPLCHARGAVAHLTGRARLGNR